MTFNFWAVYDWRCHDDKRKTFRTGRKRSRMMISSLFHLPAEFAVSDLPAVYFGV